MMVDVWSVIFVSYIFYQIKKAKKLKKKHNFTNIGGNMLKALSTSLFLISSLGL